MQESVFILFNRFRLSGQTPPETQVFHLKVPKNDIGRVLSCHSKYGNVCKDPEFMENLAWLEDNLSRNGVTIASSKAGDTEHPAAQADHMVVTGFGF